MKHLYERIRVISFLILTVPLVQAGTKYVWQGSPSPAAPYDSWTTAAHTIQEAVDAAVSGDRVLVTNGTYAAGGAVTPGYTLMNRVLITNAITVASVNGPEDTIIMGKEDLGGTVPASNGVRGVYMSGGAWLEGFTIKNGCTGTEGLDENVSGGGIYVDKNCLITNCIVTGCIAQMLGGGIFATETVRIERSSIRNNHSLYDGGGIYFENQSYVTGCSISNNSAKHDGGGIYSNFKDEIETCYIYANNAINSGGGLYMKFGSRVTYSTIIGNHATYCAGGAYCSENLHIINSIIYYNTADILNDNWYAGNNDPWFIRSCTFPLDTLPHNIECIDTEPGIAGVGNPHILPSSPCVDSGTNIAGIVHDIDGDARIAGMRSDIGCDEVTNLTGMLTAAIVVPARTVAVEHVLECMSGIHGKASWYRWEIETDTGMQVLTNSYRITQDWQVPGEYDIILTAYNEEEIHAATTTIVVISLAAATTYVSPAGNHVNPFTSWNTAATNIQAAIDACVYGGTVLVTNGIYSTGTRTAPTHILANRIVIEKPIRVKSVHGPEETIISGVNGSGNPLTKAVRCAYLTKAGILSGFTLEQGGTETSGNNYYDTAGGGIILGEQALLTNCIVRHNSAFQDGGGIYSSGGSEIIATKILSNTSSNQGGGIYLSDSSRLVNSTVEKNSAFEDGGGVYSYQKSDILNCIVLSNTAIIGRGGGICSHTAGEIRSCRINGNNAGSGGGGIRSYRSGIIADSSICSNSSAGEGGIYYSSGSCVTNCILSNNHAEGTGGLFMQSGRLVHCIIKNNTAEYSSGGLLLRYAATAQWCQITGNTAGNEAGGVRMYRASVMENSIVNNNTANKGGGMYCDDSEIKNCTISGNHARDYGGGIIGDDKYRIFNSTIIGNTAQYLGGGIYCEDDDGEIVNTIIYYNSAAVGSNYFIYDNVYTRFISCISYPTNAMPYEHNCRETEPGIAGIYNPHLLPASPAIDAGTNLVAGDFDIDHEPRVSGAGIDIGCDELTNLTGMLIARILAPVTNTTVQQTERFFSAIEGKAVEFTWKIDTGLGIQTITNAVRIDQAWDEPGEYELVLTAWNETDSAAATVTVRVVSYQESIVYVSPFGNHISPYSSWTDAATSIQAAVDVCINGGKVLVTNGVYTTGATLTPGHEVFNRVYVNKPITIQSINGPAGTCILGAHPDENDFTGATARRGLYLAGGATLSGFTISNGYTQAQSYKKINMCGGGVVLLHDSYISNCSITANTALWGGGGVYCLLGGTIYSSSISSNTIVYNGEGSGIYCDQGGTLIDCHVEANSGGTYGGGIYCYQGGNITDCRIRNNSVQKYGGGVYCYDGGRVSHSLISRNRANYGGGVFYDSGGSIQTSMISMNYAAFQGGGVMFDNGGELLQCTIHGNTAGRRGGGILCDVNHRIQNCIIYFNNAGNEGTNCYSTSSSAEFYYCCTTPLSDLLFTNACIEEMPFLAGFDNPHIMPGSPCINSGTNTLLTTVDIDGEPRIIDGTIDIGCDEVTNLTGSLEAAIITTNTTVEIHQAAWFASGIAGKVTQYTWDIEKQTGTISYTNECVVTTIWTEPGTYDVTLTAWNQNTSATAAVTVYVYSLADETVYVSPGGSHTWPYSTWATAATNIQAAVTAARNGFTVLVTNGVYAAGGEVTPGYSLSNRIVVAKAVTVRSVNGPGTAVIAGGPDPGTGEYGRNAMRCAYLSTGAVVSGFTLSNGYTYAEGTYVYDTAGGGVLLDEAGVVTNCIIVSNTSAKDGGGAACNNGGTIINSSITGNTALESGGGVMCVVTGTVEHCVIANNKTVSYSGAGVYCNQGGIVSRCSIYGNSADAHSGGGVYCFFGGLVRGGVILSNSAARYGSGAFMHEDGVLESCTITGNTAGQNGGGVYTYAGGTVRNCIIYYNNTGISENNWFNDGDGGVYEYCCTTPTNSLPGGIGCIGDDPQFSHDSITNFYLMESSPCINAGTNMSWMFSARDIAGTRRIMEGRVDMGAYEFIPEPAVGLLILGLLFYTSTRKRTSRT